MSAANEPTKDLNLRNPESRVGGRAVPAQDPEVTLDAAASGASPADRDVTDAMSIGAYQLLEKIGEGGMGQVWLAEQSAPVKRQVALKLIRSGIYDGAVTRRFASEQQALALMEHPAIAKVFDAGSTPAGQPYFVMEYVPGLPITKYCDEKKLKIRERLELFIRVCEGVQHAHQKAIIHRDLKPSNILVIELDGKPVPRIIDFGIAKATSQPGADQTLLTREGSPMGTPGYMSPEQANPGRGDVDTRTDVYSLGVVLYELLAGAHPFDPKRWQKQPFDEVLRQIREEEPPSPSTKVSREKETCAETAEMRGTEPKQLVTLLRGDLDWITMKALEKDRTRRYGTPSDLAVDIGRYLRREPVLARPASTSYRVRKYVSRHRIGVGVAAGLVLLLAGFGVTEFVQVQRITRERDRADRVTAFMTSMFKVSDPSESRGNSVTAREILDKASREIDSGLAKDPELRASMSDVMGTVYQGLGLYPQAESLLLKAVELKSKVLGPDHPETLKSKNTLISALTYEGRYAEAEKLGRETLDQARRVFGAQDPNTLKSMNNLGNVLRARGRYPESEKLTREALDLAQTRLGPEHPDTLKLMLNLAGVEGDLGRFPESEKALRDALEIQKRVVGPDHPDTLVFMNGLAATLSDEGRFAEAEKIQRGIVDIQRRILGPEHPLSLSSESNLANFISNQDRYADAEKLYREILQVQRRVLGPGHPDTLLTMGNLANALSEQRQFVEAEKLEREVMDGRRRLYGPDNPMTAAAAYDLACMYVLQGRHDEALTYLRQSVDHGLHVKAALEIEADTDLKGLHGDPRFEAIVADAHQRAAVAQKAK